MRVVQAAWVCSLLVATACNDRGTCEFTYDQASPDGSIPAGLQVCSPGWVKDKCDAGSMSSANQGLKTSGYTFSLGKKCEDIGYKDCSGGRGFGFYKVCPENMPKTAKADAPATAVQPRPSRPSAPTTLTAPLPVPSDAPFRGNPSGKLVLQVFSDLQDPFSARIWPAVKEVLATNKDLKVVFRHNPLPFHKDAPLAHQAALEAMKQKGNDGFWAMHDLVIQERRLDRASLAGYATQLQLDGGAFEKALDAGTHAARIEQDASDAKAAGLFATPLSVMDTRILQGAQPKAQIEAFLSAAK